jgi:hypothetical protein
MAAEQNTIVCVVRTFVAMLELCVARFDGVDRFVNGNAMMRRIT